MKIACLRYKRALARVTAADRAIPTVGALARHLESCEECTRELAWLRAAHHDLQISLTAEQVGAGFEEATWARLSAEAHSRRSRTGVVMAASAACAATLAVALLVRKAPAPTRVPTPERTSSVSTKPSANIGVEPFAEKKHIVKPLSGTGMAATHSEKNTSDRPTPQRHRRIRLTHQKHLLAHRNRKQAAASLASTSNKHSPGTQPIPWEQLASWYEYQGDYRAAEATYVQAVRVAPTEARLFNAGRTSECAGDVAQAIAFYTHVLKHAHEQESPSRQDLPAEKETPLCNANLHSL